MSEKNSYKKLMSNTIVFAIGSFSSKILTFLLVRLYTGVFSESQFGLSDNLMKAGNWLFPLLTLSVCEAIFRYGLEESYDKAKVFSIGNTVVFGGIAVLLIAVPIVNRLPVIHKYIGDYIWFLFLFVMMANIKSLYANFVCSLRKVKLFAFNGILTTVLTVVFSVLFLVVFDLGVAGYMLATILSDFISIVFLTIAAKLWKYYTLSFLKKSKNPFDNGLAGAMLKFCIPLMPAQILWLITDSSDSFMVTHYLGQSYTGILAASYKIANLVTTVYMIFSPAWNMSAITENDNDERSTFYTNVFNINQTILYMTCGGILLIIKPFILSNLWIESKFSSAVLYSPGLVLATVFTCFTTFLGAIYVATKKTKNSFFTIIVAAVLNIGINIVLIPRIGIYGAVISTLVAYFVAFVIRSIDARKLIRFDIKVKKIIVNCSLLSIMTLANRIDGALCYVILGTCYAIIIVINYTCLLRLARMILPKKLQRFVPLINKF